jgi:hypothetical protein
MVVSWTENVDERQTENLILSKASERREDAVPYLCALRWTDENKKKSLLKYLRIEDRYLCNKIDTK